jgi:multicomponent Na+:H+ antiporter subunit G
MIDLAGSALLIAGGVLLIIAAWGVLRLPDALARQHAATKAGTLALLCLCIGTLLLQPSEAWFWRILAIVVFLFVTLPIASHVLARAAVAHSSLDVEASRAPLVGDDPGKPIR